MIYKNMDELLYSYLDWLKKHNKPVTGEEPELKEFRRLFLIYHEAKANPPEGIIGVGAITYAEHKLQEAQQ